MPRFNSESATLAGLQASQLRRQLVLNAVARIIHRSSRYEHVIPMLEDLRWLRPFTLIDFQLAVLVHWCLHPARRPFQPSPSQVVVILVWNSGIWRVIHTQTTADTIHSQMRIYSRHFAAWRRLSPTPLSYLYGMYITFLRLHWG